MKMGILLGVVHKPVAWYPHLLGLLLRGFIWQRTALRNFRFKAALSGQEDNLTIKQHDDK